jgi:RecJ-like exonuclease
MGYYGTQDYLDLDALSAEFDALNELAITCDECEGDGANNADCQTCEGTGVIDDAEVRMECEDCNGHGTVVNHCHKCDGDGEYVPDDKSELSDEDEQRWSELSDLDYEIGLATCEDRQAIPDCRFEEYAQQLAEDIGAISSDAQWPLNRIDWEAAADDLKMDYTQFSWDGSDYWVRTY